MGGRHDFPVQAPVAATGFDFDTKSVAYSTDFQDLLDSKSHDDVDVTIYVSGLTPVLIQAINDLKGLCNSYEYHYLDGSGIVRNSVTVHLMHYDRDTNDYWQQDVVLQVGINIPAAQW